MEERWNHLTVVVGGAAIADELRRSLLQSGLAHAGISTHIRGLRKSVLLAENDLVVICIALDRATIERYGSSLQTLLADHKCSRHAVRSVGLLTDLGLTADATALGCDVYVDNSLQAARVVRMIARQWRRQRHQSSARPKPARAARRPELRQAWRCGNPDLSEPIVSMLARNSYSLDYSIVSHPQAEKPGDDFGALSGSA